MVFGAIECPPSKWILRECFISVSSFFGTSIVSVLVGKISTRLRYCRLMTAPALGISVSMKSVQGSTTWRGWERWVRFGGKKNNFLNPINIMLESHPPLSPQISSVPKKWLKIVFSLVAGCPALTMKDASCRTRPRPTLSLYNCFDREKRGGGANVVVQLQQERK